MDVKFKVGDEVTIIKVHQAEQNPLRIFLGKVGVVTEVDPRQDYFRVRFPEDDRKEPHPFINLPWWHESYLQAQEHHVEVPGYGKVLLKPRSYYGAIQGRR